MYRKIDIHIGPTLVVAKLLDKKLCDCGYGFIEERVSIGKTYDADIRSVRWVKFQCGGCGKEFPVRLIDVWDRLLLSPNWFPLDLLDIGAAIPHAPLPHSWEPVRNNMVAPPWRRPRVDA